MKLIKLEYFVPGNTRELEELVGKKVGVRITGANVAQEMVYNGIINGDCNEAEFLRQGIDAREGNDVPLDKVWGFRRVQDEVRFERDGILISGFYIKSYTPTDSGYAYRKEKLKENGLWREIR